MPSMILVNITMTWMFSCQTIAQWSSTVFGLGPGFVKKRIISKTKISIYKKIILYAFLYFFLNKKCECLHIFKIVSMWRKYFRTRRKTTINQSIKGTKIMTSYLEQRCRLSHFSYSTNEVINLLLHDMPEIRIYHSFLTKTLQCTCIRIRIA